jgi:hypothetical protein
LTPFLLKPWVYTAPSLLPAARAQNPFYHTSSGKNAGRHSTTGFIALQKMNMATITQSKKRDVNDIYTEVQGGGTYEVQGGSIYLVLTIALQAHRPEQDRSTHGKPCPVEKILACSSVSQGPGCKRCRYKGMDQRVRLG